MIVGDISDDQWDMQQKIISGEYLDDSGMFPSAGMNSTWKNHAKGPI